MAQQPNSPIDEMRLQVNQMLDSLDQSKPISAIVLFEVNPAAEQSFVAMADTLTAATRRLPGCNLFSFHKAVKPASGRVEYLIYEDWQTTALFRTQWNSAHLQTFQHSVGDLVVAAPDLRFYFGWQNGAGKQPPQESSSLYSSAFRFSWAMSMFGAQQMANLLTPSSAARAFDEVASCAESGLSGPFRAAFQAGDTMQRQFLGGSGPASANDLLNPNSWMRMASGFMGQTPPSARPKENTGRPSAPPQQTSGWGPMPQPSQAPPPSQQQPPMGELDISPEYPFPANYVDVLGSRMHYIKQGSGDPILLIHGNPSWSYSWRNIIPHLSSLGTCIAPDLIGFGRSGKPDIQYHWFDHARYLEKFIETLGLKNVTLVLHDQGSALGFHYAMRHQRNIKAIAFFEALVRPFTWENFSTPQFRQLFQQFRTGEEHGVGWQMIVDQNIFIEVLLPQATGRKLSEKEMNFYREPFRDPASRLPIWRFPRETAIGGEPADVWDAVTEYSNRLQESELPKLLLYATPGALLTQEHVAWCQQNIPNLASVNIGPGLHFLDESSPHRIGREIASWYRQLPQCRGTR